MRAVLPLLVSVVSAIPARVTFAAPISADGRVLTPAGLAFRLPPGFAYRVESADGPPIYVADSARLARRVAVVVTNWEAEVDCARARRAQVGATVRPLRTRGGLRGCLVAFEAAEGAMAMLLLKQGTALVVVTALASAADARALATSVGDSIQIRPRLGAVTRRAASSDRSAERRLVGCFEQGFSNSVAGAPGEGDSFAAGGTERCFEDDLTFREESIVNVLIPRAGGASRVSKRRGRWRYAGGVLTLAYEDGRQATWRIEFPGGGSGSVLAGGRLWERR